MEIVGKLNVPFWLLRLLPIFGYICPACRKEVKANSHECPHCGEKYPLALKVPPLFLKDPKKLEAYVHKHVFPRVSEFERAYLTKYFTVIFSSGWENSGGIDVTDGGAWTDPIGTSTVQSAIKHHGSYAMQCDLSTVPNGVRKTLASPPTHVFIRFYIYITNGPSANFEQSFWLDCRDSGYVRRFSINYAQYGGVKQLQLYAGTTYTSVNYTVSVNTWHCIEGEYNADSDSHNLWVDGSLIATNTDARTEAIEYVLVGSSIAAFSVGTGYFDCVVFADRRIGCEKPLFHQLKGRGGDQRSKSIFIQRRTRPPHY